MRTYRIELDNDAVEAVIKQVVYEDGVEGLLDLAGEKQNMHMDVSSILEYVSDNDLYTDIANAACNSGTDNMIKAFMDADITNFVDAISYRADDLCEALIDSSDNDIERLIETLVERLGYVKADTND